MRVAAIYDIHGNLPALEAVLEAVLSAEADMVVVGGDVVPGPFPSACLDALEALPIPVRYIHGNGERDVLALREGRPVDGVPESALASMRWVARGLTPEHARVFAGWPATIDVDVPGLGRVLFCHATPRSDREILTRLTPEAALAPAFSSVEADVVVCGHTHMPFDREIGGIRVVNAGSVGMPFGDPDACWLLVSGSPGPPAVRAVRTSYDRDAAAKRIRATAYPDAAGFAAGSVLEPPGEEEMLALFERSALGSRGRADSS